MYVDVVKTYAHKGCDCGRTENEYSVDQLSVHGECCYATVIRTSGISFILPTTIQRFGEQYITLVYNYSVGCPAFPCIMSQCRAQCAQCAWTWFLFAVQKVPCLGQINATIIRLSNHSMLI